MLQKIVQRQLQILEKRLEIESTLTQKGRDADLEVQDADQGKDFCCIL